MARNRVIYQSEALYVGPTDGGNTTDHKEIHRVQDISHDMSATRTDVYEFGRLAALEKAMIEAPTVTLDFSYLVTNGSNEHDIGLNVAEYTSQGGGGKNGANNFGLNTFPSAISGIQAGAGGSTDEKNYYVVTVAEGVDADSDTTAGTAGWNNHSVVGFGNGVISNYSVNAAVGDFASASVSVEAFNVSFISGSTAGLDALSWVSGSVLPTITKGTSTIAGSGNFDLAQPSTGNANVFALRPGDIEFDFDSNASSTAAADDKLQLDVGGATLPMYGSKDPEDIVEGAQEAEPMHIQNFSIDAPLTRTALTRLGSTFPYYRAIDFPLNVTMNVSALLADVQTGNLVDLMCNDEVRQIDVSMRVPCSSSDADPSAGTNCIWRLKNARLVSQNFASTIGDNKTVDLSFEASYGGATDTDNGLFISGTANLS